MLKAGPVPEEAMDARLPAFHRERASVRDGFLDGIWKGQELRAVSCVWPDLLALAGPRFWGIWHGLQKMKDGRQ